MTGQHAFVLMVTDGVNLRTIHPPALGRHRATVEAAVLDLLGHEGMGVTPTPAIQAAPSPAATATLTQGEIAARSGYSGNSCRDCGSFSMRRTGTCETCDGCGSTSGGCS